MRRDRLRAGVEALLRQLLAQPQDQVLEVWIEPVRAGERPSRPRLIGRRALSFVATDQLLDPVARHPVVTSDFALGTALHDNRGDDQLDSRHGAPPQVRCQLCPETAANYVVQPVTVSPTGVLPGQRGRPLLEERPAGRAAGLTTLLMTRGPTALRETLTSDRPGVIKQGVCSVACTRVRRRAPPPSPLNRRSCSVRTMASPSPIRGHPQASLVLSVLGTALGLAPVIYGVVSMTAGETGKGLLFLVIGLGTVLGGLGTIANSRRDRSGQHRG